MHNSVSCAVVYVLSATAITGFLAVFGVQTIACVLLASITTMTQSGACVSAEHAGLVSIGTDTLVNVVAVEETAPLATTGLLATTSVCATQEDGVQSIIVMTTDWVDARA